MAQRATIHAINQASYQAVVDGRSEEMETIEEVSPIHIDKSWHAIHYILTGSTENTFLASGTQMDIVDEHCEVHSPESVKELNRRFEGTNADLLLEQINFVAEETKEIYVWGPKADFYDYIHEYLEEFIKFTREASRQSYGFLVVIC